MQKNIYLHVIQAEGGWERKKKNSWRFRIFKIKWLFSRHSSASLKDCCWTHKNCALLRYFFAKEIFMALLCVILKPCSASRAAPAWTSLSNSTKAMSWRPGTKRTSLNPGNLCKKPHGQNSLWINRWGHTKKKTTQGAEMLLTGWRAWRAWVRSSPRAGWWGTECDWEDFPKPAGGEKGISCCL